MEKIGRVASTQEHLDIEDIRENLLILKNGNVTAVLQTTAVNFDLLSEQEQDSMIYGYAGLLNSLTYPIQVVIRTKRMDITNYIAHLEVAKSQTKNPNLVEQIGYYENFIKDLVAMNQVLDKRFYVAIPYIGIDLSQVTSSVTGLFKKRPKNINKFALLERAKENIKPKINHLVGEFARLGINAIPLNTEELIELFYDLYNPDIAPSQKAALEPSEYTTPIVEPALAPETYDYNLDQDLSENLNVEGRPLNPSENTSGQEGSKEVGENSNIIENQGQTNNDLEKPENQVGETPK